MLEETNQNVQDVAEEVVVKKITGNDIAGEYLELREELERLKIQANHQQEVLKHIQDSFNTTEIRLNKLTNIAPALTRLLQEEYIDEETTQH